jgi:hypothetical protein
VSIQRIGRRLRLALLLLAGAARLALGRGAEEPVDDAVVKLPVYTVTDARDLPPPERWSYARIEGFEVLSNASERNTRDLVQYLQRFAIALDVVWPGVRRPADAPTALVVCGRGSKFVQFVPTGAESQFNRGKVSLTLGARDQAAIIIDYEAKMIELTPGGQTAAENFEADAYQQLAREYIRFLLGGDQARFAPWFVEGIAQILMSMEVSAKQITVGRLEDPNLVDPMQREWDRGFAGALKGRALMPMERLLTMPATAEEARNPIGSTWAKQSAAFVHWGLYGNFRHNQKAFLAFVVRTTREPVSEELFKDCFKFGYAKMAEELTSYVSFTSYKMEEFRARKGEKLPDPPPLELRDATPAEIGRIKGDALRLAGHEPEARTAMLAAYLRGERDPALLAALGLVESARGESARAEKLLAAAWEANVVRPRAHVELARLRFAAAAAAAIPGQQWDATRVAAIAGPLLTARTQPPPRPEVYELLAATWVRADASPLVDQLKIVDEGIRKFPRNTTLIYDAAVLMQRAGRPADAAMIVQHGLSVATDEAAKEKLQQLRASLPVAPAAK